MNEASALPRVDRARRTAPRAAAARPAYTLVELLVAVTICSLILTSVAVALHSLFRVDQRVRREVVHTAMLSRLSLKLRNDVHAAASATTDGEPGGLQLTFAEGATVDYQAESSRLLRIARVGGEQRHREVYPLPEKARVRWSTESVGTTTLIILEIVRQTGAIENAPDAQRVQRVEAVLGLDQQCTRIGP